MVVFYPLDVSTYPQNIKIYTDESTAAFVEWLLCLANGKSTYCELLEQSKWVKERAISDTAILSFASLLLEYTAEYTAEPCNKAGWSLSHTI